MVIDGGPVDKTISAVKSFRGEKDAQKSMRDYPGPRHGCMTAGLVGSGSANRGRQQRSVDRARLHQPAGLADGRQVVPDLESRPVTKEAAA
jgi:hypothetical protein